MADNFQLKAIISAVDKITPVLKGVARSVKITHKALKDIGTAGGELMRKVGIPAALSFGAVAYGAINATRAALDFAGGIQDSAERTGASVEGYQSLANMLGLVGGTAEDAERSFNIFNKGIAEASGGVDKEFAGLMKKMRIPLKDAQGHLRGLTDVMPELADAFAANKDPATRTRMAMELFGKSGVKMIPILIQGGDALRAMTKEQERLGGVLSAGAVGALDDMGDSIGFVGMQIRTQWASAVAKMVPIITPLIKQLTEWIAKNKELIQTTIVEVLTGVAAAIKEVDWVAFIKGVKDTVNSVREFVAYVGGVKNIVIALGLAWIAGPLAAILSIGMALARFAAGMSMLLMANPIILAIVAVVALLAGAAYLIYKNWEPIKAFFSDLWNNLGRAAGAFVGWLAGNFIAGIVAIVTTAGEFIGKIAGIFVDIWNSPKEAAASFLNWILEKIQGVLKIAQGLISIIKGVGGAVYDFSSSAVQGFSSGFSSGMTPQAVQKVAMPSVAAARNIVAPAAAPGLAAPRTSPLVSSSQPRINGDLTVHFENSPPGMRVDQGKTNQPGWFINPDAGYRTLGAAL